MGFVCKFKQFVVDHFISSKDFLVRRARTKFIKRVARTTIITVLAVLVIERLEKYGIFLRFGKAADAMIAAYVDHVLFGGAGGADVD